MSGHEGENATDAPPEAWEGADPPEVPRLTFQDEVESMEALIGMVLDQYEITALLGYGAMGCVYRVRHQLLGRDYALKMLSVDRVASDVGAKRFLREAQAAAQIDHKNVVRVVYSGTSPSGAPFLVMELLQGQSLMHLISEGPLAPERAASIARQLALGLTEIHKRGFVHRDIKPSNIMLVTEGGEEVVKILDLGLVGLLEPESHDAKLTQQGNLMGTPLYMAPETFTSGTLSPRTDLYSLGAVLFEMLSGAPPFNGSIKEILWHHCFSAVPPLEHTQGLDQLVIQLMSKDESLRPADAAAVVAEIDRRMSRGALARIIEDAPKRLGRSVSRAFVAPADVRARGRWKRRWAASAAGAALALGGLSFAAVRYNSKIRTEALPLEAPVSPVAQASPVASPLPTPSKAEPALVGPATVAAAKLPEPTPTPVPSPSAEPRRVVASVPREVLITSDPPGARVELGGGILGLTPISVPVTRGKAMTLKLHLDGYPDQRLVIGPTDTARARTVRFRGP
ncbi:MAG: serine/threonine-protein kinase [Myxococcota bacterium]